MSRITFFSRRAAGTIAAIGAALLCRAGSANAQAVTYNKNVAPIFYQQCVSCHRPDEVAPFSLLTYHDAQKRARQIALITEKRIMPPWKLEPGYGAFKHERRLTDKQIAVIKQWAAAGAPEGDPADLPPAPKFTDGWQLGKPDLIIKMPKACPIPAAGNDVNRSFPVRIHLPADKYIRAAEFRPGNRRVVHHATLMLDKSGKAMQLEAQQGGAGAGYVSFGGPGFIPAGGLPGYAPGMPPEIFPPDAAGVLPKEVDVVFGMHYHPTGKAESDQSSIGLYFTDKPPTRIGSLITMGVLHVDIAPGEKAHFEQDDYTLPVDVDVEAIYEHLHLIGKTCKLWAELPDHTTRPLIKINDWDFNWQNTYHVKERVHLPKGTVLHAEWTHDNTAENIHNPNHPPKRVTYGENSTDEMAGALINVYVNSDTDNGILWIANLTHLGKASVAPARRPAKEEKSRSLGLVLMGAGYEGLGAGLIGIIEAPLRTLGTLLTLSLLILLSALLIPSFLFPKASQRAADTLALPLRCFGVGLLALAGATLFALPLLFSASLTAQACGVFLWVGAAAALGGMSGLVRQTAEKMFGPQDEAASFSLLAKSSLFLTLAFVFPILGWFVIAPLTLLFTLGAGLLTLGQTFRARDVSRKTPLRKNILVSP